MKEVISELRSAVLKTMETLSGIAEKLDALVPEEDPVTEAVETTESEVDEIITNATADVDKVSSAEVLSIMPEVAAATAVPQPKIREFRGGKFVDEDD